MMEYTDHYFRKVRFLRDDAPLLAARSVRSTPAAPRCALPPQMARVLTKRTRLYTEMVVSSTLWFNASAIAPSLRFSEEQHPVALQLGGSDPMLLAHAAALGALWGYDEINLNCGCPSERVASSGCFGAAMMLEPDTVKRCCEAMIAAVEAVGLSGRCAVTVKCRLGADDMDSYAEFRAFADAVAAAGVYHLIVHSRKCWLAGLSTRDNRNVPPLRPEWVLRLAAEAGPAAGLRVSVNGQVRTMWEAAALLRARAATPAEVAETEAKAAAAKAEADAAAAAADKAAEAAEAAAEAASGTVGGPFDRSSSPTFGGRGGEASEPKPGKRPSDAPGPGAKRSRKDREAAKAVRFGRLAASTSTRVYDGPVVWAPPLSDPPPPPASSSAPGALSSSAAAGRLLDSVMVGRGAYDLWRFADADRAVFGAANPAPSRREAILSYLSSVEEDELAALRGGGSAHMCLMRWASARVHAIKPVLLTLRGMACSAKVRARINDAVHDDRRAIKAWAAELQRSHKEASAAAPAADEAASGAAANPVPTSVEEAVAAARRSFAAAREEPSGAHIDEAMAFRARVRPLRELVEDGLSVAPAEALDERPPTDPEAPWWDPIEARD